MTEYIQNEAKTVPFSSIEVPKNENVRETLEEIRELASSIEKHGLLQGLLVTNGQKGDKPYRLVAGFRRAAALKLLKWGDRDITVTVVPDSERAIKNVIENVFRQDIKPADLSRRVNELHTGTYPVSKGEVPRKYPIKELADRLGLSDQHLYNLMRADANLADEVKEAWHAEEVPQELAFKAAAMTTKEKQTVEVVDDEGKPVLNAKTGEVKTKEVTVTVPDVKAQTKLLTQYKAQKEKQKALVRGKKKGDVGPEDGTGSEDVLRNRPTKRAMADFVAAAKDKLAEYKDGTVEYARLQGRIEGVSWAAGERKGLAPRS